MMILSNIIRCSINKHKSAEKIKTVIKDGLVFSEKFLCLTVKIKTLPLRTTSEELTIF